MKELTEEEIDELAHFASLFFGDRELAAIMAIPFDTFRVAMLMAEGPIYETVTRARLISEAEVRRSILDMAKRASTPAQHSAELMIRRMKAKSAS